MTSWQAGSPPACPRSRALSLGLLRRSSMLDRSIIRKYLYHLYELIGDKIGYTRYDQLKEAQHEPDLFLLPDSFYA